MTAWIGSLALFFIVALLPLQDTTRRIARTEEKVREARATQARNAELRSRQAGSELMTLALEVRLIVDQLVSLDVRRAQKNLKPGDDALGKQLDESLAKAVPSPDERLSVGALRQREVNRRQELLDQAAEIRVRRSRDSAALVELRRQVTQTPTPIGDVPVPALLVPTAWLLLAGGLLTYVAMRRRALLSILARWIAIDAAHPIPCRRTGHRRTVLAVAAAASRRGPLRAAREHRRDDAVHRLAYRRTHPANRARVRCGRRPGPDRVGGLDRIHDGHLSHGSSYGSPRDSCWHTRRRVLLGNGGISLVRTEHATGSCPSANVPPPLAGGRGDECVRGISAVATRRPALVGHTQRAPTSQSAARRATSTRPRRCLLSPRGNGSRSLRQRSRHSFRRPGPDGGTIAAARRSRGPDAAG